MRITLKPCLIQYLNEWGRPEYVVEQLRQYREFLKPRSMALVIITKPKEVPTRDLRQLGVEVFQEMTSPRTQEEFKNYINKALQISESTFT